MPYQDREHIRKAPTLFKTFVGLTSGTLATALVHPLDLVKTRMQLSYRNLSMVPLAKCIVKHEGGKKSLYTGLTAALTRNVTTTAIRLGTFYTLSEWYWNMYNDRPSLKTTIEHAVIAGALGAAVGNPAELILVRMLGDGTQGRVCPNMPVRYTSLMDGIKKVTACEGFLGLWRGGTLSVLRSVIISSLQLYSYTKTQRKIQQNNIKIPVKKDGINEDGIKPAPKTAGLVMHLFKAMLTSVYISFLTLPIDLVKTWYQYLLPDHSCTQPYILKSLVQCRSMLFLWKGFLPYYLRMCTHTFITFLLLDRFCSYYVSGALDQVNPFHVPPRPPRKWSPWE